MTLGARPLRDSLWLEFSQPRERSNNSLTNGNSSGGRVKGVGVGGTSRSLTVQFFSAVTVRMLKQPFHFSPVYKMPLTFLGFAFHRFNWMVVN